MPRKKQETIASGEPCASPGCAAPGDYRAPKSRTQMKDYQWLCLDHVREFNKGWDYFDGMNAQEIEYFMQDAVTGHRPTWQREERLGTAQASYTDMLEHGIHRFMHWGDGIKKPVPALPAKERKALAVLDLETRPTPPQLKKHYRALVKRHHPDLHKGAPAQEEKFKQITAAYAYLLKLYEAG